jgi:hypothetical protein
MFHLAGWAEDIDGAGATTQLAALADPLISTSGDALRVPELNQILALAGGVASGGTGLCQLIAPSLREIGNYVVAPVNGNADADVETDDPPKVVDLRDRPLVLEERENATAEFNSNTSAAAFQYLLAIWSNGIQAAPSGNIRTLRFTNTDTMVARAWTNGALTATEELPAGEYAVVGMRAVSATMVAARLVPRGAGWRPGCIGGDVDNYEDSPMFRNGGLGEWLRFVHDNIPSVDFLCDATDSNQDVHLDLVKVA